MGFFRQNADLLETAIFGVNPYNIWGLSKIGTPWI